MRDIKHKDFQEWLIDAHLVSSPKQASDCASRLRKIEKAFAKFDVTLDDEWERDKGYRLLRVLARDGRNPEALEFAGIDLPLKCAVDTPVFDRKERKAMMYHNTLKRYLLYRGLSEGMTPEEISEIWEMSIVVRNYLKRQETH